MTIEQVQDFSTEAKHVSLREPLSIVLKDNRAVEYYLQVLSDLRSETGGYFRPRCLPDKPRSKNDIEAVLLYLHWRGKTEEEEVIFGISPNRFVVKKLGDLKPQVLKGLKVPSPVERSSGKHLFTDGQWNVIIEVKTDLLSGGKMMIFNRQQVKRPIFC